MEVEWKRGIHGGIEEEEKKMNEEELRRRMRRRMIKEESQLCFRTSESEKLIRYEALGTPRCSGRNALWTNASTHKMRQFTEQHKCCLPTPPPPPR